jgi:hypothetical protein
MMKLGVKVTVDLSILEKDFGTVEKMLQLHC